MELEVHQFVHTLNEGDAISGETLAIRRLLQAKGISSEIYCLHAAAALKKIAKSHQSFAEDAASAVKQNRRVVAILHYSIASPLNEIFLKTPNIQRVLIYHNLTPAHWYESYNPRVTKDLVIGRDELPQLLKQTDLAIADSEFNASELVEIALNSLNKKIHCEVLPLVIDTQKWSIATESSIEANLKAHGGMNILSVGRLAPNKCLEDVLKAFYFYHHKINKKSRLWLIGGDSDTELYSFELRALVSELRLKEAVSFLGVVSDQTLKAFYENCHLYMCMSEHEGFCVPLIESMHFGMPVIAHDSCAVAETLGEAGFLIREKSPAKTAELMNIVLEDASVRDPAVSSGKKRVENFSEAKFSERLDKVLLEPLQRLWATSSMNSSEEVNS